MAGLVNTVEAAVLNYLFNNADYSYGRTAYVGLFASGNAPTDSTTGTELSGNGYARQAAGFSTATTDGAISNSNDITFPTATASWGTITHVGIFSASSAGQLLAWGALTVEKTVGTGDSFKLAAGDLDVTLD